MKLCSYLSLVEFKEKKGLVEGQTKPDEPICLILSFVHNNSEKRLANVW